MLLFLLGMVCGAAVGAVLASAKSQNTSKDTPVKTGVPKVQEIPPANTGNHKETVKIHIPIEVQPNVYSLSVAHPTVKYKKATYENGKQFEHICIDCELHYELNGRKEGKRYFVFSYYDQDGNVVSHHETKAYKLTDSGMEIVHAEYYVPWRELPKKIGISVREVSD